MTKSEMIKAVYDEIYKLDSSQHYIVNDIRGILGDKDVYKDVIFLKYKDRKIFNEVLTEYGIDVEKNPRITGIMSLTEYRGYNECIPTILICTDIYEGLRDKIYDVACKYLLTHELTHYMQYCLLGYDEFLARQFNVITDVINGEYYVNELELEATNEANAFINSKLTPEEIAELNEHIKKYL